MVRVPDGIDLSHAIQAVTDALYLPENVTQDEYNLVEHMLEQLRDCNIQQLKTKSNDTRRKD